MQENNTYKRPYKIMLEDNVIVYRNDINNIPYYKVMITKTNQDGTKDRFYKEVKFKKGVELKNKTMIKIKSMLEDARNNPKDQYHPIFFQVILDFDILENPFDKNNAINTYNNTTNNEEIDDSYFADVANQQEEQEIETPW